MTRRMKRHELLAAAALLLAACGGGGGGGATSPTPPPAPAPAPSPAPSLPAQGRLSADTPVAAGCGSDSAAGGTLYANAEVEPWVALQPGNPNAITAAWQQDRWRRELAAHPAPLFALRRRPRRQRWRLRARQRPLGRHRPRRHPARHGPGAERLGAGSGLGERHAGAAQPQRPGYFPPAPIDLPRYAR